MAGPGFYMICRSPRHAGSRTEPKQRFANLADAQKAAQDMADQTGEPFVVLSATHMIWPGKGQQSLI
jgi:hypothetical protein